MEITAVAAIDLNCAIGYKGELLFNSSFDKSFFKELTSRPNTAILCGRKTFESLPTCLSNRHLVVLTENKQYKPIKNGKSCKNAKTVHGLRQMLHHVESLGIDELFVIGGGEVYKQMMPLYTGAYLTIFDKKSDQADAHFPRSFFDKNFGIELIHDFEPDNLKIYKYSTSNDK